MKPHATNPVVLFDGVCNLCNASVQFVVRHDQEDRFRFASLQSPLAQRLLQTHGFTEDFWQHPQSVVLLEDGRVYTRSEAALRIARLLPRWRWVYALRVLPVALRDAIYGVVASRRYVWFGKSETCLLPSPALRSRFLNPEAASDVLNLEADSAALNPKTPQDTARKL